jgi:hypothetical protein
MSKIKKNIISVNFENLFNNDDKCLELLAKIKWGEDFLCKKCGNNNYCKGKTPFSRRCTRCKHDESATAHTIFHNLKFPISKAFYIAYQICNEKKKISSYEFARNLSLRQMTCWKFREKVIKAMNGENTLDAETRIVLQKIFIPSKK